MSSGFVAVEGPNGVGKTTAARLLAARLGERSGLPVHLTAEPSDTLLGRLLRSAEATLTGRALALAVAADRYAHVDNEIIPLRDNGHWVVTDRYVQSSLVLQRLDGLELREIWQYNQHVPPPTVSVYLVEDPGVIAARLAERSQRSRLELAGSPARELELYDEAFAFLAQRGWTQVKIDCQRASPADVVDRILKRLDAVAT